MLKRIIFLGFLLAVLGTVNSNAQFAGGSGTEEDPYQLSTAQELDSVRYYLEKHFILINDIDLDIEPYNSDEGWYPIGNSEEPFTGSINSDTSKSISLKINKSTQYVGLILITNMEQIL